jgi:hypothetical protein
VTLSDEHEIRLVAAQRGADRRMIARGNRFVGIERQDPVAGGLLHAEVPGQAEIVLPGELKQARAEGAGDRRRAIAAASIDNDHIVDQTAHRFEAASEIGLLVPDDHAQAQCRRVGHIVGGRGARFRSKGIHALRCTISASADPTAGKLLAAAQGMEQQMPRLIVNSEEQMPAEWPESWGPLLSRLEQEAVSRGEVVTEVRFDGVDEPTFWQPAQVDRPLLDVALVEVMTAPQGGLLDDALVQGAVAAGTLAAAAIETGEAFRGTNPATANQQLADLCDGVRSLIALSSAAATAVGVRLDEQDWNGRSGSKQMADLGRQLESIIEAQQSQDWLTVADILEYDFHPALNAWRPVFETLRTAASPASKPLTN